MDRTSNSVERGNPSTPPPSRTSTNRPQPPWPVSPATPHSPTETASSPKCPGAPIKKRRSPGYSIDHDEDERDNRFGERMPQDGIVPRKLDFSDVQHDSRGASSDIADNSNNYPFLDISSPLRSAPTPYPNSAHSDNQERSSDAPVLEMRPRRQGKHSPRPL